jgi:hypothetical protein
MPAQGRFSMGAQCLWEVIMPGPAPKDPSVRRRKNVSVGKTLLPAEGRTGPVPAWPFSQAGEPETWCELWTTPQSVAWERAGWIRTVARYALLLSEVEVPDAKATLLGEVRQLEDRLGLNPKAMRTLLWEVVEDEVAEKRDDAPSKVAAKRAQLKIVG